MFILRSLFWLSTLVILLPASPDGGEPPRVSLLHTAYAVRVILQDVTGVCQRNPDACAASREALALLTQKLATGANIVTASVKAGQEYQFGDAKADHGTLTPADLEPTWSVADSSR
jgi:hypothetical protein